MTRRYGLVACCIAVLGPVVVAGTVASDAAAASGSYQVSACNYAPADVNNSWTWSTTDASDPSHYAEHTNCSYRVTGSERANQEGGLSTTDELGLASGAPPEASAGWIFTAPAGTTITGITYERDIGHMSDPNNSWSPALRADGTTVPGETCLDTIENGETCSVGGPPDSEPAVITRLAAHQLTLGIACDAPSNEECVTGATEHKAWAAMYGARVTLSDIAPPTLGAPSGALWGPGAYGGFHKGTESVAVSAQDVGGGVKRIVLSADGVPVETYAASCDFTKPVPCPLSTGAQTLTLPTTQLSDGTHTLTLVAIDAAGNESTVASEQITVDNSPPPAPVGLSATETAAGARTFTATWDDPAGQLAPITASTYQVCPAGGSGACEAPAAAPPGGPATITVPGVGVWTLSVWLTNAAGNNSESDAARTTLTVAAPGTGGGGSTGSKARLHVTEVLHGRKLVVTVTGPSTGTVHVGYAGRYRGRLIASGAKKASLRGDRVGVTFRLSERAAAHATIRVSARLGRGAAVISPLRRDRSRKHTS
jgi:hypothetical protein